MALMCRHFYAFTTYVHILIHRQNHIEMYVYPKCVEHTQTHLSIYTQGYVVFPVYVQTLTYKPAFLYISKAMHAFTDSTYT